MRASNISSVCRSVNAEEVETHLSHPSRRIASLALLIAIGAIATIFLIWNREKKIRKETFTHSISVSKVP